MLGNYFIFGGVEIVLVFWQIDVGWMEIFFYLLVIIENIIILLCGVLYVVYFDDNFIMVFLIVEMKLIMYVFGIQFFVLEEMFLKEFLVCCVWWLVDEILVFVVVIFNLCNFFQMFLCVGNGQQVIQGVGIIVFVFFVQVFDFVLFQGVFKYVIVCISFIEVNIIRDGQLIMELMVISFFFFKDGKWLVLIDEW